MTSHSSIKLNKNDFGNSLNSKADSLSSNALASLESLVKKTCRGSEWTGWFDWPKNHGFKLVDEIESWKKSYSVSYDTIVVIGIGGSYLGAKAVVDIMSPQYRTNSSSSSPEVLFAGQNMSESALADLLSYLENKNPILNVISKTGTTTEPGVAFRVLNQWLTKKYGAGESAKRIIAITDKNKGALRTLAKERNYKSFEVPDDVGGRYSVFTAVGLVPLALAGFDIKAFITSADAVFSNIAGRTSGGYKETALDYAKCRNAAWNSGKVVEVVTYIEPRMRNTVEWFKQLFAESDGKQGKGLFPTSLECTMDLHSIGQYLQEGARTMIETFITIENPYRTSQSILVPETDSNLDGLSYLSGKKVDFINQKAVEATKQAHSEGGVPCLEINLKDLSIGSMGALMALLQVSCAVGGFMMDINPFDQPGVEAYKLNMFRLLGKP